MGAGEKFFVWGVKKKIFPLFWGNKQKIRGCPWEFFFLSRLYIFVEKTLWGDLGKIRGGT